VHFVRHAEGEHNVAGREDPRFGYLREDLEDAKLTAEGVEQCRRLRSAVQHLMVGRTEEEEQAQSTSRPDARPAQKGVDADAAEGGDAPHPISSVELIVVSPLQRTLETAEHSFAHMKGRVPWLALESVRETMGLHPCDRRRNISQHRASFPHINFDHIEHDADPLWHHYPTQREPEDVVERRGRDFLAWLAAREEESVVLVTHSSYLRTFCSRILGLSEIEHFENADLRSVELLFEQTAAEPGNDSHPSAFSPPHVLVAARPVWDSTGHHKAAPREQTM
jgi:broad specificity phosphatase PhoE